MDSPHCAGRESRSSNNPLNFRYNRYWWRKSGNRLTLICHHHSCRFLYRSLELRQLGFLPEPLPFLRQFVLGDVSLVADRIGHHGLAVRHAAAVAGRQPLHDIGPCRDGLGLECLQLELGRHLGGQDADEILFQRQFLHGIRLGYVDGYRGLPPPAARRKAAGQAPAEAALVRCCRGQPPAEAAPAPRPAAPPPPRRLGAPAPAAFRRPGAARQSRGAPNAQAAHGTCGRRAVRGRCRWRGAVRRRASGASGRRRMGRPWAVAGLAEGVRRSPRPRCPRGPSCISFYPDWNHGYVLQSIRLSSQVLRESPTSIREQPIPRMVPGMIENFLPSNRLLNQSLVFSCRTHIHPNL